MVPQLFGDNKQETDHPFKRYQDRKSGFSLHYPELPGWVIHTRTPGRLVFKNRDMKATLIVAFIPLPNVVPDLSDPQIFRLAVTDIAGSYQKSHPHFELVSSSLVTNPNNSVKGVQLVYHDRVAGRPWKGRCIAFFTGRKRYDVTAFAEQESFDAMDTQFFTPVTESFTF